MAKEQSNPSTLNTSSVLTTKQKLISAVIGSEADLLFTHPIETAAKLKQNAKITPYHFSNKMQGNFTKETFNTLNILYKGVSWSALNKLSSRTMRYVGQDSIEKNLQQNISPLTTFLNEKQKQTFFGATSGITVSMIETVAFYPLDILKTRNQLGGVSSDIYHHLYKGLLPTLIRSSFSSALFFGSYNFFSNGDKENIRNNLTASLKASLITTGLNNPIEVIKTRLQAPEALNTTDKMSTIIKKAITQEGMMVFSKGLFTRLLQAPIKIALPFFTFTYLKQTFEKQNSEKALNEKKTNLALP